MEFLIECADPAVRKAVRGRLRGAGVRLAEGTVVSTSPLDPGGAAQWLLRYGRIPAGVLGWMLAQDDPGINAALYHDERVPTAVRCDIRRGLPYRPGAPAGGVVPFRGRRDAAAAPRRSHAHGVQDGDAVYASFQVSGPDAADLVSSAASPADPRGLVWELRQRGMRRQFGACRLAADAVGLEDWDLIAQADRDLPLPGFARWALCVHPLCPTAVRGQLGGGAPYFAKRMRRAGIYRDSAEFATYGGRASHVLEILDQGRHAFPDRLEEARALLQPAVQRGLGGNLDAWAVLAQLLPTFAGSLPELVATSAAIGGGVR